MANVFEAAFKLNGELTSSFRDAMKEANRSFTELQAVGEDISKVGKTLSKTVTAPVVAMGTAAFVAAVDFESAFAGVRKTVDGTEADFKMLEDGIRGMAKELPASASSIAEVAENAGQLGIQKENILDFTRTMIDLGEATNMTSEDAATAFAQFANVVQMPQENFDRLGSSVVALGNSLATTESDIVNMAMRLSGVGAQVGLTESDIMALSGAMSSVGINAEAGGSAMSTVMKKIHNAVASGGADMQKFAQASGMSSSEFADAWNNEPIAALDSFIKGLSESGASGENLNAILDDLGIKGIQESDAILRLAGASELLGEAVDTASSAWEENTALSEEAAERYATTASQLAMLRNKVIDVAITIGNILIPYVLDIVGHLGVWIDKFSELDESALKMIMAIAGVAAAVGPVLVVMGTLIESTVSVMRAFTGLKIFLAANPFVMVIGAIIALGAAFVALYKHSETFRNAVDPLLNLLKHELTAGFDQIKSVVLDVMPQVIEKISEIVPLITNIAMTILPMLLDIVQQVFPIIASVVGAVIPIVVGIISTLIPVILLLVGEIIPLILSVVEQVFPIVLSIIQGVLPIVASLINIVVSVVLELIEYALPLLVAIVEAVFPVVLSIIQMVIPIVIAILNTLVGIIQGVLVPAINAIMAVVEVVFPYIQMMIENALTLITGIIQVAMALIQGDWDGAWNTIKATAETIMNNIISFFQSINLFDVGKSIIDGLITGIQSMGGAVVGAISGMIPAPIRGAASKLLGAIPGFAEGGIVDSTTLAWIGEGGDTEAVIPWNSSSRSKDLWLRTGQELGMLSEQGDFGNAQQQTNLPSIAAAPVMQSIGTLSEQGTYEEIQQRLNLEFNALDATTIQPQEIMNNNVEGAVIHVQYAPQYTVTSPDDLAVVKQHSDHDKEDLLTRLAEIQRNERRLAFG